MPEPTTSGGRAGEWDVLAVIGTGGALGAAARWGVGQVLPTAHGAFPLATFLINVTGCFALGLLMVFVVEVWAPSRYVRPFVGVGVLGGFTTFSTYVLEARGLLVHDRPTTAVLYAVGSLLAGFLAVWLGIRLGGLLAVAREARRRPGTNRPTALAVDPDADPDAGPDRHEGATR